MKGGFKKMTKYIYKPKHIPKDHLDLIKLQQLGEEHLQIQISFTTFDNDDIVSIFVHDCRLHNVTRLTPKEFYEFVEKVKEAKDELKQLFKK